MPFPPDYHMHTPLCRHAVGSPSDYAAAAVAAGLEEIGFSDHNPMAQDNFDDWRMRLDQLDEYVQLVEIARRDFPTLRIKLALEVDYIPGHEEWIRDLSARHPWDYLIGSVHYVARDFEIDNPAHLNRWKNSDPFEVWSIYLDRLTQAASSKLFEIIGHADLPKKFGFFPEPRCTPLFERFLQAARQSETAIEINTAGLRKTCAELYPSASWLQLAQGAGVALTFGSDAHAPGEVAMNFPEALAAAKAAGYSHSLYFHQRNRSPVPIK